MTEMREGLLNFEAALLTQPLLEQVACGQLLLRQSHIFKDPKFFASAGGWRSCCSIKKNMNVTLHSAPQNILVPRLQNQDFQCVEKD